MNLHEYQGKFLFAQYNLPVSKGKVISNADEAANACNEIGGTKWVIKAQVHAGGRGKSGGVELIDSCLLYTSPSPRDRQKSRMPASA
mgnify:CR=1 FL=1